MFGRISSKMLLKSKLSDDSGHYSNKCLLGQKKQKKKTYVVQLPSIKSDICSSVSVMQTHLSKMKWGKNMFNNQLRWNIIQWTGLEKLKTWGLSINSDAGLHKAQLRKTVRSKLGSTIQTGPTILLFPLASHRVEPTRALKITALLFNHDLPDCFPAQTRDSFQWTESFQLQPCSKN